MLPQIIISSIILFLGLMIFFPFPKLFIILLVISILSVIIIAIPLKKLTDSRLRKLSQLTGEQLRKWAIKQYNLTNKAIIFCTLIFLTLPLLGFSMIWIFISEKSKDKFVGFIAYFGAGIALLGIYFIYICICTLRFRKKNRDSIIDESVGGIQKFRK
ncbi:MAG: hypothetical protein V1674_03010 [Candidatus Omnitrophota bacterium]